MLYLSHPACLEHDPRVHMPSHPDSPCRLQAIEATPAGRDWLGWRRTAAPAAGARELVHTPDHVRRIRQTCVADGGAIDSDTFVGEASYRAALHAAGGACAMVRALLGGEDELGFCGVRPAGHHAEPDRAILISAGFDAHGNDPLGDCSLDASSFGQMACHVRDLARELGAPIGAVLEGGYDIPSLVESMLFTMGALGGEGDADSAAPEQILTPRAAKQLTPYWQL